MKLKSVLASVLFLAFCVSAYGVEVNVPDVVAETGSTITIAVNIDDATGLSSADIVLEYDPTVLEATEARRGDLTATFLMASNLDVPGKVTAAMAGFPGIPEGAGSILEVDFLVLAPGPASSPLTLSDVALFNEEGNAIDATVVDGSVSIAGEEVTAEGTLTVLEVIPEPIGTHGLFSDDGTLLYALESSTLTLDDFVGEKVTIKGIVTQLGVDDGPDLVDVSSVEVEEPPGPPVVREHDNDSLILALEASFNEANVHGHAYVDIWAGEIVIEAGMFLEYQISMFSGNPTFNSSVDLHTSDGGNLRDSGSVDQNGITAHPGAELSGHARDQWYHRQISLDALVGKTVDGATLAVDSNEHFAGLFRSYADNIQITDGTYALLTIYAGENAIPLNGESTSDRADFTGVAGMSGHMVSIVGETPVEPAGKLISTWGKIKNIR